MERDISGNQASIKTATVELQVIRVDNRQMTISVFRQLPRKVFKHHWAPSDILNVRTDDVWGWVNYHAEDYCGCKMNQDSRHIHLVVQVNGTLGVATIPMLPTDDSRAALCNRLEPFNAHLTERQLNHLAGQYYIDGYRRLKQELPQLYIAT